MSLTAAVVGCGAMGSQFDAHSTATDRILTHAHACHRHPDVSLVAGIDTEPERREQFSTAWERRTYRTVEDAASDFDLDLVCVSTPPAVHKPVIADAVEQGVRAVLCEKPIAEDVPTAERIVDRCDSNGVVLAVNYLRRYAPGVRRLREAVRDNELGSVRTGVFTFTKGLHANGTHMVDLAMWLFGEVNTVERLGPDHGIESVLGCENGSCRLIGTGIDAYSQTRVDLYGDSGAAQLVDNGNLVKYFEARSDPVYSGFSRLTERSRETTDIYRATYHAVDDIVTAVRDGESVASTGKNAVAVQRVCRRLEAAAD
jgi:predicted dehydrogenase